MQRSRPRLLLALSVTAASALALGAFAVGASGQGTPPVPAPGGGAATATMMNANGQMVGTVRLVPGRSGKVEVRASVAGIQRAGFHGFHVHQTGVCDPAARNRAGQVEPFASAGAHHRRAGEVHGGHAGDFPPLLVADDGRARARVETDTVTVAELLDADGSAVMIHAGRDNLANIPPRYRPGGPDAETLETGDAGARAACGLLRRVQASPPPAR